VSALRNRGRRAALAAIAAAVVTASAAGASGPFAWLVPAAAPSGWKQVTLPNGTAVLALPPALHLVKSDSNAVAAARKDSQGNYLAYVNATPKEGGETLADWPKFRVEHLREESAQSVHTIATSTDLPFLGGRGSCVIDVYVTKVKQHAYHEVACFVQGAKSSSVVIAAAPPSQWAKFGAALERAVADYRAR
jgi:hypothetical protein